MRHDALVEFNKYGAGLTEAPIVFGRLAEVRKFAGGQGTQAGFAVLGPGNHGGGMEGSLVGGAVTGGLAAASVEVVDGAFDELTQREQDIDLVLVVVEEALKGLTKTTGVIRRGGQGSSLFMLYTITT
jgi:hypothetical protein